MLHFPSLTTTSTKQHQLDAEKSLKKGFLKKIYVVPHFDKVNIK